jgi:Ca2+-binding RTX toxin-like protein
LGKAGNDKRYGDAGNDTLDGGIGMDTMYGGDGNDTYYVDGSGDVVFEYANQGIDTVISSITYTLGNNVEKLTLTGTAIEGIGNRLDNVITGNSAYNMLYGNEGNDTLYGDAGNDYLFGEAGDNIMYGGDGNDILIGDTGNELFYGGIGNDTLIGRGGNDTLTGEGGNDNYQFSIGYGSDIINDTGTDVGTDIINFSRLVSKDTIAFFQNDSNLHIVYGNTDSINVLNQDATGIEKMQLNNGLFLTNTDINLVIQQMTAFADSSGIQLTSVDDVKKNQELMGMVVNAWHQ